MGPRSILRPQCHTQDPMATSAGHAVNSIILWDIQIGTQMTAAKTISQEGQCITRLCVQSLGLREHVETTPPNPYHYSVSHPGEVAEVIGHKILIQPKTFFGYCGCADGSRVGCDARASMRYGHFFRYRRHISSPRLPHSRVSTYLTPDNTTDAEEEVS